MQPVYQRRGITLHCGDTVTLIPEIVRQVQGRRFHIITDPPYSSGGRTQREKNRLPSEKYQQTGTKKKYVDFEGDHRDARSMGYWMHQWLRPLFEAGQNGGHLLMFSDWRQLPLFTDVIQAAGFIWHSIAVWDKTPGARPVQNGFRMQSEFIVHGSRGPIPRRGRPCLNGVFSIRIDPREKQHVTAKPLELMRQLLKLVDPGDLIIDPFAGSGTTLVAAAEAGIEAIGIEAHPEIAAIATDRLKTAAS